MAKSLYTVNGAPLFIGRELGRVGEAAVFDLPSSQNQVAKIYHKAPDMQKQAKLPVSREITDEAIAERIQNRDWTPFSLWDG